MFVKPLIGNVNQLVIKTPLCNATLIPRYQNDCSALWIERESDSQTPPSASKRSSFMLAWLEPFNVSTYGRPRIGPLSRMFCTKAISSS